MALIAPLIAFIGRQVGRIVQAVFGWATLMLFGRVPQSRQLLSAAVSFGAVAWLVAVLGVVFPGLGGMLVDLVPGRDLVGENTVRLVMLGLALALPIAIGVIGLFLMDKDDRPTGVGGKVIQVLRGYPYAAVLALVIVFLLIVAPIFKLRAIVKRWEEAHIPIVVKPGGYDEVATELERAVDSAGLDLARTRAPRVLEVPSRLLAWAGGASVRRMVPDRLVLLKAKDLEVTIHAADVAMIGSKEAVARARAAIADRLTRTEAYLTVTEESQRVEDELLRIRHDLGSSRTDALAALHEVDTRLSRLVVPYEEWEVLYRQRLQLERDLLRGTVNPTDGERSVVDRIGRAVEELLR